MLVFKSTMVLRLMSVLRKALRVGGESGGSVAIDVVNDVSVLVIQMLRLMLVLRSALAALDYAMYILCPPINKLIAPLSPISTFIRSLSWDLAHAIARA
jgi:hypothetical protein